MIRGKDEIAEIDIELARLEIELKEYSELYYDKIIDEYSYIEKKDKIKKKQLN